MTSRDLAWLMAGFVTGWMGLLLVKYDIIGLRGWDAALHPARLPCDIPEDQ